ncbi:MAG: hypothetical protein ACYC96_02125 [Fimbriimonadaceae bacterium]
MVKKKSPIIPLTFVAIGVALAFAVNSRLHPVDPKDAAQAPPSQPQDPTGGMRPLDKTSVLKAAMTNSLQKGMPNGAKLGRATNPDEQGSIMVGRKPQQYKPTPSATSTDSGWYVKR